MYIILQFPSISSKLVKINVLLQMQHPFLYVRKFHYCSDKSNTLHVPAWLMHPSPSCCLYACVQADWQIYEQSQSEDLSEIPVDPCHSFVFESWPCLFKVHSAGTTWVERGCLGAWAVLAPVSKVSTGMSLGPSDGDQGIILTLHTHTDTHIDWIFSSFIWRYSSSKSV